MDGKTVLVLGGDGFCGWPASLRLSSLGAKVTVVDNGSRRRIDAELGTESLTRICSLGERAAGWSTLTNQRLDIHEIDLSTGYDELLALLSDLRPDIILHFAEQRSAPYSMFSSKGARYSVDNNTRATHNVLAALVEANLDPHLVHLGTIGVYGYSTAGLKLPEGYVRVTARGVDGREVERDILYPGEPDSLYHLTKVLDQQLCAYYARRHGLRITDLHQGIVWGTQTDETRRSLQLVNRIDHDPIFGTVVNRFLLQALDGQALTVYGSGDQVRAFIHIEDMLTCIALAASTPPERGERVRILNQFSETGSVNLLAQRIREITGAEIAHIDNPRLEPEGNEFDADRSTLHDLGFRPRFLADGLGAEFEDLGAVLCRDTHAGSCSRRERRA